MIDSEFVWDSDLEPEVLTKKEPEMLGKQISVFQETFGEYYSEWLVNFDYFIWKCSQYNLYPILNETVEKEQYNKIKNLLSSNVFTAFSNEIKSRVKKKHSLEHTLISLKSADIEKINVKSSIADIVVKFASEQVNLLKNKKGEILSGNDEYIENHIDYWTFSKDLKSTNPNWKLVVTKSEQ